MFQLTKQEWESLRFQIETLEKQGNSLTSQIVTLKSGRGQHSKYLPYAFTEQGVAMLSGILNSDRAINMNIAIMRAFVEVRRVLLSFCNLLSRNVFNGFSSGHGLLLWWLCVWQGAVWKEELE